MPNLSLWSAFSFLGDQGEYEASGSPDSPLTVSGLEAAPYKNTLYNVAQNGTGTLWNINNGPADFKFAYILSNQSKVILELTTDLNNLVGKQTYTVTLAQNIPLPIASSQSYANYTAGFGGGTLSAIQQFKIKNLNTAAATVKIWLFL